MKSASKQVCGASKRYTNVVVFWKYEALGEILNFMSFARASLARSQNVGQGWMEICMQSELQQYNKTQLQNDRQEEDQWPCKWHKCANILEISHKRYRITTTATNEIQATQCAQEDVYVRCSIGKSNTDISQF